MSQQTLPNDMELAALIASKVCHDVINPVGAINNGLEMLDEEDDPEARRLRARHDPQRHRARRRCG